MKAAALCCIIMLLLSCNNHEAITIYSDKDFYEKIKIVDTACISARKRANHDIKNGKLTIHVDYASIYHPYDYHLLKIELQKIGISLDTVTLDDNYDHNLHRSKLFISGCYQNSMRTYILQNKGKLLDTVAYKVEKRFIMDNPTYVFDLSDLDYSYKNEYNRNIEEEITRLLTDFQFDFIYPKDYSYGNIKKSETIANFIIRKNGTIDGLSVVSKIHKPENQKFEPLLNKAIRNTINNADWNTAYSHGLPVNVLVKLEFRHK